MTNVNSKEWSRISSFLQFQLKMENKARKEIREKLSDADAHKIYELLVNRVTGSPINYDTILEILQSWR